MIDTRDIDQLLPEVAKKAREFIALCEENGIKIIITSTYRDFECQDALFAKGRTKGGKKVTNARAGYSYHNFRVAFDVVPVVHGKAVWGDMELWDRVGAIGQLIGLEWGGSWKRFVDRPHFQYTKGLKLAEFRAGKAKEVFDA